jgi:hypothetical protein
MFSLIVLSLIEFLLRMGLCDLHKWERSSGLALGNLFTAELEELQRSANEKYVKNVSQEMLRGLAGSPIRMEQRYRKPS